MKVRTNWIALGLILALGSWYYFYEIKGKASRDQADEDKKLVFENFDPAAVQELLIQKGTQNIALKKSGTDWAILQPVSYPADSVSVGNVLDAFKEMKREDVVDEKGEDAKDFGLLSPAATVSFATGPGASKAIRFGMDSPTQEFAYAQVLGEPAIFTTQRMNKINMMKELKDLRDKSVFSFQASQVSSVASSFGKGLGIVTDAKGNWQLSLPKKDKGDHDQILSWFQQIQGIRIQDFADEKGLNLAKYGLAAPAARMKIQIYGNTKALVLDEGAKVGPNKGRYFKIEGKPLVFSLGDYVTPILEKKADDLADHKAFKFQPFEVQSFDVVQGGKTLHAIKSNGSFAWNPALPKKDGAPDFDFLGFLSDLSSAEVLARLSESNSIPNPLLTITLRGDKDAVLEKISLGAEDKMGVSAYSLDKNQTIRIKSGLTSKLPF